jgi:hypothetical protein
MSLFRLFLVALVTAFVVTNSLRINTRVSVSTQSRRSAFTKCWMTATTDELAVAYDQIKLQVRLIITVSIEVVQIHS